MIEQKIGSLHYRDGAVSIYCMGQWYDQSGAISPNVGEVPPLILLSGIFQNDGNRKSISYNTTSKSKHYDTKVNSTIMRAKS